MVALALACGLLPRGPPAVGRDWGDWLGEVCGDAQGTRHGELHAAALVGCSAAGPGH